MENNDSNLKPQSTGGLKLMTVFVGVLALHVVVIASICTYCWLKGSSSTADADTLADKLHQSVASQNATSDSSMPDPGDKSTPLPVTTTDMTSTAPASTEPMTVSDNNGTVTTPASPSDTTTTPAPVATTSPDSSASPTVTPAAPASTTASVQPAIDPLAPPADPTPAPVVTSVTAASTTGSTYVVKHGDVLERIAHSNHISVAKLKEANSLKTDDLKIGQKLTIPAPTPAPATATATATTAPAASSDKTAPAKTVAATTAKPAVKPAKTVATNGKPKAKTAIVSNTPAKPGYYTVVKGDNLTKIAHKFKTTPRAIIAENNLSDPKKLSIGTKLKIPSREARSASITPATASTQLAQVTQ